jgi:DNA-binding transcriptional ArsR family regulator
VDDLLNLFGILSDRTRLRILLLLLNNELCVCEIFATLDMSQPRVSRQLAILKQSKIIKDRREGKWIYYRIDENEYTKHLMSILSLVPDWLCDDAEFNNDKSMLKKVSAMKDKKCSLTGGDKFGE